MVTGSAAEGVEQRRHGHPLQQPGQAADADVAHGQVAQAAYHTAVDDGKEYDTADEQREPRHHEGRGKSQCAHNMAADGVAADEGHRAADGQQVAQLSDFRSPGLPAPGHHHQQQPSLR